MSLLGFIGRKKNPDELGYPRASTSYMVLQSVEKQVARCVDDLVNGKAPESVAVALSGTHSFVAGFTQQNSRETDAPKEGD